MKPVVKIVFITSFFVAIICFAALSLRLPYESGESFQITQGYNSLPTHINKDLYALDLSQDGCSSYGKQVLAVADGKVKSIIKFDPQKIKQSYGNAVKIDHDNNIESIYAHLKNFIVEENQEIKQGELIGYIGNTGWVDGSVCLDYPGTHLHFAMYQKQEDGSLVAYKPEPISGYTNLLAGMTLKSDNILVQKEKPAGLFSFITSTIGSVFSFFNPPPPAEPLLVTTPSVIPETIPEIKTEIAENVVSVGLPMSNINNQSPPPPSSLPPPPPPPPLSPSPSPQFVYASGFGGGAPPPPASTPDIDVDAGKQETVPESEPEPLPSLSPPADTTPPDISLSISECQNSLAADNCLIATTTINISWSSSAEDLDYFEFQGATTTATSTVVSTSDNSSNTFSVRAKDTSGNWSDPQTTTVVISSMPIVINEVAWAGTGETTYNDEWIELYNRTNSAINFDDNNWVLYSQTDQKPWINLTGTIPAKGYYLIERTDDDTVSDIPADWKGSFGNGLKNSGEVLVLSHASTTVDQTALCENCNYRVRYTHYYRYYSAERIDYDLPGDDLSNWGINNTYIRNGKNAKGEELFGTPKARNSLNYLINNGLSYINSNITLKKERSPYFVYASQIFQGDSILTIEPGVVIKFYFDTRFIFKENSAIKAQGTESDPIVFTSFTDNGVDHSDAGEWFGVEIQTANNNSIFDHTIFRYAGGHRDGGIGSRANLFIYNASATITNSIFEYSRTYGLALLDSDSVVANNIFRNNNQLYLCPGYDCGNASALSVEGGSPLIKGNSFSDNYIGLYVNTPDAIVDSNTFTANKGEAIFSVDRIATFTNNSGSGNNKDAISVYGGWNGFITIDNATTTIKANSLPYFLNGAVQVSASSTLIIEKGVVIKGAILSYPNLKSSLGVAGNLIVSGESPDDVIFTSETPVKGSWEGIVLHPGSFSSIKGATISYAEVGAQYQDSPIYLGNVKFEYNEFGVSADSGTVNNYPIKANNIIFTDGTNTNKTSPPCLFGGCFTSENI